MDAVGLVSDELRTFFFQRHGALPGEYVESTLELVYEYAGELWASSFDEWAAARPSDKVSIFWYVTGSNPALGWEWAPGQNGINDHFLSRWTRPRDSETGKEIMWRQLPYRGVPDSVVPFRPQVMQQQGSLRGIKRWLRKQAVAA